jgi:hypothetical protein
MSLYTFVSQPPEDGKPVLKDVGVLIIVVRCILFKCTCCWTYWQLIHVFVTTSAVFFLHHFHDPFRAKVACLYDSKSSFGSTIYHIALYILFWYPLYSQFDKAERNIYIYIHTHTEINSYIHTYIYKLYTYITYKRTYIYEVYIYTHTCIHYIHTSIHK